MNFCKITVLISHFKKDGERVGFALIFRVYLESQSYRQKKQILIEAVHEKISETETALE